MGKCGELGAEGNLRGPIMAWTDQGTFQGRWAAWMGLVRDMGGSWKMRAWMGLKSPGRVGVGIGGN